MTKSAKTCLVVILFGASILPAWAKDQEGNDSRKSPSTDPKPERSKRDREKAVKMWALGCSAVLVERNHARHDLLASDLRTERNIEKTPKLIEQYWSIKNQSDLFGQLRWLYLVGHRAGFGRWGRYLQTLAPQGYEKLLATYEGDQETLNQVRIAQKYYRDLGTKSLWAWNYSRYICLCRWGYMAGYITDEQASNLIMDAARMLQKIFDGWEDLGRNYLIGRRFWSYKETKKAGYLYEDAYQRLLDMPSSPWNKYPWDMDLSDPHTADESNE